MIRNISIWHVLIVVVVILLLFGANRLPGLAKSLGQSMKILKSEVKDLTDDGKRTDSDVAPGGPTAAPTAGPTGTAPDGEVPPPPAPPAPPRP